MVARSGVTKWEHNCVVFQIILSNTRHTTVNVDVSLIFLSFRLRFLVNLVIHTSSKKEREKALLLSMQTRIMHMQNVQHQLITTNKKKFNNLDLRFDISSFEQI